MIKVSNKLISFNDFKKDHVMKENLFFNVDVMTTSDIEDNIENDIIIEEENNICDVCGCTGVNCTCDSETKSEIELFTATKTDEFMPKIFSIVKLMTQNGEKIAMCYSDDVANYGTPIYQNLDFKSACDMVKNHCSETGCEEYKAEFDNIVGAIPSFMIQKKGVDKTSYK